MSRSMITLKEAAQLLGKSRVFIWMLFLFGDFPIYETYNSYIVNIDDVYKLIGKSFFSAISKNQE